MTGEDSCDNVHWRDDGKVTGIGGFGGNTMLRLTRIHVEGFLSFREVDLDVRQVNVLIGGNGAGKSNVIKLLKMLKALAERRLGDFVREHHGANCILHYGAKVTPRMRVALNFAADNGWVEYHFELAANGNDALAFADESMTWCRSGEDGPQSRSLGSGHMETHLADEETAGVPGAKLVRDFLLDSCAYHFRDISRFAHDKPILMQDAWELRGDGSNLPNFLLTLEISHPDYYQRIVDTIRQVAPHFRRFSLGSGGTDPSSNQLRWYEEKSDYLFNQHQLPDGLLRFMALATLLLEPPDSPSIHLPPLIGVDEPELGLHPFALNVLVSLIRKASTRCQFVLATQSVSLVDRFDPEEIVRVEREGGASVLHRLDPEDLAEWLEEYSLGELWEKNVIGGRP